MIDGICLEKYKATLYGKTFTCLRKHALKEIELRALLHVTDSNVVKKLLGTAFAALKSFTKKERDKDLKIRCIDRLFDINTTKKCFTNWLYYTTHRRRLR